MKIQVLHIADCPNWESVGPVLKELIQELGLTNLTPTFTLIRTPEEAAKYRFAGSPTILIDGNDVVPGAEPTIDLACRVYHDGSRMVGSPTKASLREALLSGLGNADIQSIKTPVHKTNLPRTLSSIGSGLALWKRKIPLWASLNCANLVRARAPAQQLARSLPLTMCSQKPHRQLSN